MIGKIEVKAGFAKTLPVFSKKLEFKRGLNILFGPNGCGKTTALNIAAAYSGVGRSGGWTRYPDPYEVKGLDGVKSVFPSGFCRLCVGKIQAEVEWDGSPTYYADVKAEQVVPHAFSDNESEMMDQLAAIYNKPSSGQLRLYKMARMIHGLKPPDLQQYNKHVNEVWLETYEAFNAYVNSLPRNGPVTLLLDEPDRSLSIPVQFDLWTKGIPRWASRFQVIVATHSPFCLTVSGNLIECVDGYVDDCREALKASFS